MQEIWSWFYKGGITMIPLSLCSLTALAVIIERAISLRRRRIVNPDMVQLILDIKNPHELKESISRLENHEGAFIRIVHVALEHEDESDEEIRETIMDQGRRETLKLEAGLSVLETIAGVAPLLGLLGTVLGMIKVFNVISEKGLGQTQLLSGGISEALITTVYGLTIAIPSLIAYNYFSHKVENLVLEIEDLSSRLHKKLKKLNSK